MVDDVGLGAFIRAAVMVGAEIDVYFPILELLPGQGQRMTAAVAEQQSPKQILSPHPGRTVMFCPDFCSAGADGWVEQNETATRKICAIPKTGSQDLVD